MEGVIGEGHEAIVAHVAYMRGEGEVMVPVLGTAGMMDWEGMGRASVGVAAEVRAVRLEGCSQTKSSESDSQLKWVCASGASSAIPSSSSDALLDISMSETSEAAGEVVGTSVGKVSGTCIV